MHRDMQPRNREESGRGAEAREQVVQIDPAVR